MGFYFNSYLQYKTPPWLSPLHIHAHAQKKKKIQNPKLKKLMIYNTSQFKYTITINPEAIKIEIVLIDKKNSYITRGFGC